jgi:hypothetical protein
MRKMEPRAPLRSVAAGLDRVGRLRTRRYKIGRIRAAMDSGLCVRGHGAAFEGKVSEALRRSEETTADGHPG